MYPAVNLSSSKKQTKPLPKRSKGFFLIVSRLSKFTKYKRVDLAIQACSALGLPLKIIGSGSWEEELKAMAGPSIEFLGKRTDDEVVEYYKNCKALIFPGIEDFGLAVVEAQKFGKPVIAFRGGGAIETIKEGKTGYFFNEQTKASLMEALKKFDKFSFEEKHAIKQAELFGKKRFKKDFLAVVNSIV